MARKPGLRCSCGAFAMVDDKHVIRHGIAPAAMHTHKACDHDPNLKAGQATTPTPPPDGIKPAPSLEGQRVFKVAVQKGK